MLLWTAVESEDVETVTTSPVEVVVGLETPVAVTSTASPPAMMPQPLLPLRVTVAPLLLVTALEYRSPSPS